MYIMNRITSDVLMHSYTYIGNMPIVQLAKLHNSVTNTGKVMVVLYNLEHKIYNIS